MVDTLTTAQRRQGVLCKVIQGWTEILDPDDEICLSSYQAVCIGTMKNHLLDRTYASLCHLSKLYCDRVKPSQPSSFSQQLLYVLWQFLHQGHHLTNSFAIISL